jgi:hypothetical protein
MNDRDRLEQLRGLLDRLERMPASADRDWMLGEVRARTVDVESGATPAAVRARPQDEADAEIAAAQPARVETTDTVAHRKSTPVKAPRRATRRAARTAWDGRLAIPMSRPATPSLVRVRERAGHESAVDLLEQDGLLCLDDPHGDAAAASRPWAGGLRG